MTYIQAFAIILLAWLMVANLKMIVKPEWPEKPQFSLIAPESYVRVASCIKLFIFVVAAIAIFGG